MELSEYRIISNEELMPRTWLMWLEAPRLAATVCPGQFAMLRCGDGLTHMLRRPLSVHAVDGSRVAFLYRVVGDGTAWLAARREGEIDVLGPLGNGYSIASRASRLLLVAGGMGLAPIRFLAETALERGYKVQLLLGARNVSELYPLHLLPKGLAVFVATEDGSVGEKGMVTDFAGRFTGDSDQVFACGREAMYQAMVKGRQQYRALPVQVSLELRMGCGVGACLSCTIGTRQGPRHVCKDGPVFDFDDINWSEAPVCRI